VTRIDLGLAAHGILLPAVGHSLLYGLGLARLRRADVLLLGLSYLLGWAALASLLSLALIVGIPSGLTTVVLLAAALVVCGVLAGRRTADGYAPPARRPWHPAAAVAAGLGGAVLAVEAIAALVVSVKSEWITDIDVLNAWLPRAHSIHLSHQLDATLWGSFLAPWYPPLAPVGYATTFDFVGGFHPSVLPFQQTLLGIAFLLAVVGLLARSAPPWLTLPSLALLTTTPWFWWRLQSLLPDQTLAYLLVIAAIACVLWLDERRGAWLGVALVLLTAATLTKLEGLLFGSILVVVVLVAGFVVHRRAALPACVLLLAPLAILPWRLWLATHEVVTSSPEYNTTQLDSPGFLADRIDRLTYALEYMLRAPFTGEGLTAVMVCLSLAVLLAVAPRIPAIAAAVGVWLGLSFIGLACVYWIANLEVDEYLGQTASRVGTTLIIAAWALSPLLLGLALRRSPGETSDSPSLRTRFRTKP
jgi:hypothetical protein